MTDDPQAINRDWDEILPALRVKIRAVMSDVAGHLGADYRLALFEGVRSQARQDWCVKQGTSHTYHSKHLRQADGFAHAGDLMYQRWRDGAWHWLAWQDGTQHLLDLLDSAKRAHGVMDERIVWDHPHCQWMG